MILSHGFRSSPEVIIDGKYSEASDVWAFAVLIWEMFTLMALNDDEILYDDKDKKASSLPYNDLKSKEQVAWCDISKYWFHNWIKAGQSYQMRIKSTNICLAIHVKNNSK